MARPASRVRTAHPPRMAEPEIWDDETQEQYLDTQLRLATLDQRVRGIDSAVDNLQRIVLALEASQRRTEHRQNILTGILAASVISLGLIAAFAPMLPQRNTPAAANTKQEASPNFVPAATQQPLAPPQPVQQAAPGGSVVAGGVVAQNAPFATIPVVPPVVVQPPAPKLSPLQSSVAGKLKTRGEDIPASWQPLFDAEAKGDQKAKLHIAAKFLKGDGVRADQTLAVDLIRHAADSGEKEALLWLASAYQTGAVVKKDIQTSISWFEKAGKAGVYSAYTELGRLYETGIDGAPDLETALGWYQRAAQNGEVKAAEAIGRVKAQLNAAPAPVTAPVPQAHNQAPTPAPVAAQTVFQPAPPAPQPSVNTAANKVRTATPLDYDPDAVYVPMPPSEAMNAAPAYMATPVVAAAPMPPVAIQSPQPETAVVADVRAIQRMLRALGYRVDQVDGAFGPATSAAIKSYQRNKMMYPDGAPSPELMDRLMQDLRFGG